MTQEVLRQLSTGDLVINTKSQVVKMVVIPSGTVHISIEEILPLEDWELHKSRLVVTKEELDKIAEYHRKIKEQEDKNKKR